jgi:TPR repeat protein
MAGLPGHGVILRNGSLGIVLAGLILCLSSGLSPSKAETRRAFLVGVQDYKDPNINRLSRTRDDARDLGKDLEEVGFDKKNIKVVTDVKNKDSFDKEFNAFLKTIEPGDTVVFFFSGHGIGIEVDQTNYLLLADLKSPFAYAKAQMPEKERKNDDVVRLKIPSIVRDYEQSEIPKSGISASEIEKRLAERKPKYVIMILDACRSLVSTSATDDAEARRLRRGETGSRLVTSHTPLPGFLVLYSASFGEQAVESFGKNDGRRNSLFTEVLRSELQRPGQTLIELAERVKLMTRSIAQNEGYQQEPEFAPDREHWEREDFVFVGSIGRERFQLTDKCAGDREDWERIKNLRKRELFERHRRRFESCGTADLARQAIARLGLGAEEWSEKQPVAAAPEADRGISACDRLAASELDPARPPEVRGVPFDQLRKHAEEAVAACNKAVDDNPRITRFFYNLGRAYQVLAANSDDKGEKALALHRALVHYNDAAKRGYVSALNNLAVLYSSGDGVEENENEAISLFKRAAQQGHPLAMYNLALHYRNGTGGLKRDFNQATEWFAKSAESGYVPAMVEMGDALKYGRGIVSNPRRAVEWYQRAAEAGSAEAKLQLGWIYFEGRNDPADPKGSNSVRPDHTLALLWLGRVAESGDSAAQGMIALMMEKGLGLPNPQPEVAERYWRMAAHGGNGFAEVEFADRLRRGLMLVKQEFGDSSESITLLQRAMNQGLPQAALSLAQIYRNGELGQNKQPREAMKLAYRAIALSVLSDPTTAEGKPFYEIAAGHLLVEMAKNNEAVDDNGTQLLTQDEIDRLERYYGSVDPNSKQVKVRRLEVDLDCWGGWTVTRDIWVWDWGRSESPTAVQFRNLERETGCSNNDKLRRTLIDIFEQAKKNSVPFADLIDQKIKTAKIAYEEARKRKRQN